MHFSDLAEAQARTVSVEIPDRKRECQLVSFIVGLAAHENDLARLWVSDGTAPIVLAIHIHCDMFVQKQPLVDLEANFSNQCCQGW